MAVRERVFVGRPDLPALIEVPGELHRLADWDRLDGAAARNVCDVLNGKTNFGRRANHLLGELAGSAGGKRLHELLRDDDTMTRIHGFYMENDPLKIRLLGADRIFMKSTEVGKAFKFEGVHMIKDLFRGRDMVFEDAEKLGLDPFYKPLFNEFKDVPGFQKVVRENLNHVLNFREPWGDMITNLTIAKSLKVNGFRILEFEGRETE
ncbi:hypothetical protein ACFLRF_06690, partial [Candidatus Altiarchaeota archaeon]